MVEIHTIEGLCIVGDSLGIVVAVEGQFTQGAQGASGLVEVVIVAEKGQRPLGHVEGGAVGGEDSRQVVVDFRIATL